MLVDSDVLIDYLRGREPSRSRLLAEFPVRRLQTTVINQFELLAGARRPDQRGTIEQLLRLLDIVALDSDGAAMASNVRRDLQVQGLDIGMGDSLIAGVALAKRLPLLTRNRRHFGRVPDLKLIDLA